MKTDPDCAFRCRLQRRDPLRNERLLNVLPVLAGLVGVAIGGGLLWLCGAHRALGSVIPYKAALMVALCTMLASLFPWALVMTDSPIRRTVTSLFPTLAEEGAKAGLAKGMLSAPNPALALPATALACGAVYGTIESALVVYRCMPEATGLAEQLCAFSVLIRPTGQALMTFCTMLAVVHRRWAALGLLVITHLIVNWTALLKVTIHQSTLSPAMADFLYDAARQLVMVAVAGLIALWLGRVLRRQGQM